MKFSQLAKIKKRKHKVESLTITNSYNLNAINDFTLRSMRKTTAYKHNFVSVRYNSLVNFVQVNFGTTCKWMLYILPVYQ